MNNVLCYFKNCNPFLKLKLMQSYCSDFYGSTNWNLAHHAMYICTAWHTTVLLLFWNMPGTTRVSRYQKGKTRQVKTNLDLLEQETVSGSGICWPICKVSTSSQTTTPTSHHSVFYRPDALPATQPTASKH